MEYPELEIGEDNLIFKELISAYKAHIATLESEVLRLRLKYEPTPLESASGQVDKYNPPPQRPKLTTMAQVIREMEKRASINPGVTSEEVSQSK